MRKAERLFQILTLLRGRRTVLTARDLAERLQVSERTIYRIFRRSHCPACQSRVKRV